MQNVDLVKKTEHYKARKFIVTYKNGKRSYNVLGF